MQINRFIYLVLAPCLLASCAYMQSALKQEELIQAQKANPRLHHLKHIVNQETFFIYGLILDDFQSY